MEYGIIAFVISSLLGSGVFLTPGLLIPNGLIGFLIFIVISILFFLLGNHLGSIKSSLFEFLKNQLGFKISSLILWAYWIVSWASTSIVIIEMINYMGLGQSEYVFLFECFFVLFFTFVNWFGLKRSIYLETILTWVKVIPLIIIPGICMWKGESMIPKIGIVGEWGWIESIKRSIVSVLWLFVGIESGAIISNKKSYKKEISVGIIIVIFIYFINIYGISLINTSFSLTSYSDSLFSLFGSYGQLIINILVSFVCFGTINAWIISSTITAKECAEAGIFPQIFRRENKYKMPYISLLLSNLPLIIIFFFLRNQSARTMISNLLDLSSNVFLIFYSVCLWAILKNNSYKSINEWVLLITLIIIVLNGNLFAPFVIILSGLNLWIWKYIGNKNNKA
jgi:APA family basic amino acid/polyamine antiporter